MHPYSRVSPSMHLATYHEFSNGQAQRTRERLLTWYGLCSRDLPWRIPPVQFGSIEVYDQYVQRLYITLVSESMLQQTQVKSVVSYFDKWVDRFPSLQILALADEQSVMACWAGLGYYSRARRLQQAAKFLNDNFVQTKKEFPKDPSWWVKNVPGVGGYSDIVSSKQLICPGPYTAGALLSISFDIEAALVDGNVQRVLSRVLALRGDTTTPNANGTKLVWTRAKELVQGPTPGNLNQSLMELGATICTPLSPKCGHCPISADCLAFKESRFQLNRGDLSSSGPDETIATDIEDICSICSTTSSQFSGPSGTYIQSLYPFKRKKPSPRLESAFVYVRRKYNKYQSEKKIKGLLAGLYDFPTTLLPAGMADDEIMKLIPQQLGRFMGHTIHRFTHIKRISYIFLEEIGDTMIEEAAENWFSLSELEERGVSQLCLKNFQMATGDQPKIEKGKSRNGVSQARGSKQSRASSRSTNANLVQTRLFGKRNMSCDKT